MSVRSFDSGYVVDKQGVGVLHMFRCAHIQLNGQENSFNILKVNSRSPADLLIVKWETIYDIICVVCFGIFVY